MCRDKLAVIECQSLLEFRKILIGEFQNNYILMKESLNSAMKIATKAGTDLNKKSAGVISYDQEEEIWKHRWRNEKPENC